MKEEGHMPFHPAKDWNPKQARLNSLVRSEEGFEEAMRIARELHAYVHAAEDETAVSLEDEVFKDLSDEAFRGMPTEKDVTIAWNIWHITRIEDIAANILIAETAQVLDDAWLKKLNTSVRDTGNAMTDPEILRFSQEVDRDELIRYRREVGRCTREVFASLRFADMRRKVKKESIAQIFAEGAVLDHPDSVWLLDFWGKKDIAGLITMPITRHQAGHISDSFKLKERYGKKLLKI